MQQAVQIRTLERAVELFNGEQPLAEYLKVPTERLRWWLHGSVPIPNDVFLALVDVLLDHGLATLRQEISGRAPDAPAPKQR